MSDFLDTTKLIFSSDILIYLLSLFVFPLIIKYISDNFWSILAKKKNAWKRFIADDEAINNCFEEYKEIENESYYSGKYTIAIAIMSSIFLIAEMFIFLFISSAINHITVYLSDINSLNITELNQYIIYTFLFLVLYIYVGNSKKGKKKDDELSIENIKNEYKVVAKIFFKRSMFSLVQLLLLINTLYLNVSNITKLFALYMLFVPLIIFFSEYSYKKKYEDWVKKNVNDKHFSFYPTLKITTMGSETHTGKIKNVFDDDAVILVTEYVETVIPWDGIASITGIARKKEQQKKLSDY
ncbi:MAG: hypothetical protein AWU58_738 [Methanohalophilus sp. T328-1]|nr:MAG: hypothetical protein AWU58_738 [Methanohalophilus sp. T328-1]